MSTTASHPAILLTGDEIVQQYARLIIRCLHWSQRHLHIAEAFFDEQMADYNRDREATLQAAEVADRLHAEQFERDAVKAALQARRETFTLLRPQVRKGRLSIAELRERLHNAGTHAATGLRAQAKRYRCPTRASMARELSFAPQWYYFDPFGSGGELAQWDRLLSATREQRTKTFLVPLSLLSWYEHAEARCNQTQAKVIELESCMPAAVKKTYLKLRGR